MTPYVRNNIRFRSAASKALEGFFNSKAFILNELISDKAGLSEPAREIMLVLFNHYGKVIGKTENDLLLLESVADEHLAVLMDNVTRACMAIKSTFEENNEVFPREFLTHWRAIHKNVHAAFLQQLEGLGGATSILAMPYLTECLIEYLGTTLFELYELDTLLGSDFVLEAEKCSTNCTKKETLVLFVSDMMLRYAQDNGLTPELDRLEYYSDNLIDKDRTFSVEIRDYSEQVENLEGFNGLREAVTKHFQSRCGHTVDVAIVKPDLIE